MLHCGSLLTLGAGELGLGGSDLTHYRKGFIKDSHVRYGRVVVDIES